jgi:hypothetical protein
MTILLTKYLIVIALIALIIAIAAMSEEELSDGSSVDSR